MNGSKKRVIGLCSLAAALVVGVASWSISKGGESSASSCPNTSATNGYCLVRGSHLVTALLDDSNLTTRNLSHLDLRHAHLAGANLEGANLAGTDLTDANLVEVSSGGITGTLASLPAEWWLVDGDLTPSTPRSKRF
jgi:uncharacterized protein YjbI with pentapeptide repeats